MAWPTQSELRAAERTLRHQDKALRLWRSMEHPEMLSLDRKTFRGRIGAVLPPDGAPYPPDAGHRREQGLIHVAYVPAERFDLRDLSERLKAMDTWRAGEPLWRRVEDAESRAARAQKTARREDIRYRAVELWDDYVWKTRSRVAVSAAIS